MAALQVLVVSMHDSAAMQSQCQRAGAAGFVSKAVDPLAVLRAVRAIQAGLRPQSSGPRPPGRRAPHEQLTAREFAVMQLLVTGASVEAIARQLEVSDKTVSNYQTLIRQKLGVNNTVDLLHYAQRHGIVP
jgi:DNA-binding NarL/FixJ family response regulator